MDLATVAGQALQMQHEAQDLSTSNLPTRAAQPETVPAGKPQQQEQPAEVAQAKPARVGRRKTSHSAGDVAQRAKKARVAEGDVQVLGSGGTDADDPPEAFAPEFVCPDGHVISVADSLAENPILAMTLLNGVALPRDMEELPTAKAQNMAELCLHIAKVSSNFNFPLCLAFQFFLLNSQYILFQAGQCASQAFSDIDFLLETRKTLRADLQGSRAEAQRLVKENEELEEKISSVTAIEGERDRLLAQVKDLTAERDRLVAEKKQAEDELPKKLEEAADAGFNEAGEEYTREVQKLIPEAFQKGTREGELKGILGTHESSFLLGFQKGLDYMEVPENDHRREPPVVPPVQLPSHLLPNEQKDAASVPIEQASESTEQKDVASDAAGVNA